MSLLIVYAFYHSAILVKSCAQDYLSAPRIDAITDMERRFGPMKARLSTVHCKHVGYVTDIAPDFTWGTDYLRVQYVLAPIVVSDSIDASFIVANLKDPSSITNISGTASLSTVADYGDGVLLLSLNAR